MWHWDDATTRTDTTKKNLYRSELSTTETQIDGGARWPLAHGALVDCGLLIDDPSADANWAPCDFLIKYEKETANIIQRLVVIGCG
jgi:hypothetical protein